MSDFTKSVIVIFVSVVYATKNKSLRGIFMKKFIKTISISVLIISLGTASFASPGRINSYNFHKGALPEQNAQTRKQMPRKNMHIGQNDEHLGKTDFLGTVGTVNTETKVFTVKDSDGKETQVHVNPFTHLRQVGKKNEITLSDIKSGDWVAVKKFETETKTLEASRVIVVKE